MVDVSGLCPYSKDMETTHSANPGTKMVKFHFAETNRTARAAARKELKANGFEWSKSNRVWSSGGFCNVEEFVIVTLKHDDRTVFIGDARNYRRKTEAL